MHWFRAHAPIRQKMSLVVAFFLIMMAACAASIAIVGNVVGLLASLLLIGFAGLMGMKFREAICSPYVATVVRMEALAAGDLDSPIHFTEHRDCVGRMTKAMFTFQRTAREQLELAADQARAVEAFGSQFQELANGNLAKTLDAQLPGGFAELKASFNRTVRSLNQVMSSVVISASDIETGSSEIAQASEDLARRTESNAASLEQTSAAITQMDGRLKATASAAVKTVASADEAIATVSQGRTVAQGAVGAMERVRASAKGIDVVIEGVDKVAFQTRVLAMNAAVEAGRAGEAGKGFAVVADLVSALARRAEEEAKRARDQLGLAQADITEAVDAVGAVDDALEQIAGDVNQVHDLLATMANDNLAQSQAISEITAAVASMDAATQQNAAMVEETSAAARNLLGEVSKLNQEAARFQLSEQPHPSAGLIDLVSGTDWLDKRRGGLRTV